MEAKSVGQIAYEAYGNHQHWLTCTNMPMVSWPSIRADIQAAWHAAAQAVLREAHGASIEAYAAWLQEHRKQSV